jgi:hypothetical protein
MTCRTPPGQDHRVGEVARGARGEWAVPGVHLFGHVLREQSAVWAKLAPVYEAVSCVRDDQGRDKIGSMNE